MPGMLGPSSASCNSNELKMHLEIVVMANRHVASQQIASQQAITLDALFAVVPPVAS
jgi:hypothetical protein